MTNTSVSTMHEGREPRGAGKPVMCLAGALGHVQRTASVAAPVRLQQMMRRKRRAANCSGCAEHHR